MKTLYTLLLLVFSMTLTQAQIVTIPDANFKHILTTDNCVDLDDDGIGDADADTNDDGEIQVTEAEAVEYLILTSATPSMQVILDLTGLDAFVNLKSFNSDDVNFYEFQNNGGNFEYVGVNSIDFTPFSSMERIRFSDELSSVLTSINVSGLTNLTDFTVFWVRPEDSLEENRIPVAINFQGCTSLLNLNFANSLADIDFCQVPSVETVVCWELYPTNNTNLDFNCLINLKNLDVSLNPLNSLYLKNGSVLETFINFSTSGNLLCIDNNQAELDSMGSLIDNFSYITSDCEVPFGANTVSGDILANLATNNETCSLNSLPGPLKYKLIQNSETVLSIQSNTTDTYEIPVGEGDYQVSISTRFSDGFTVEPNQFDVSFPSDNGGVFMQDICLEPRVETVDGIEIRFYPSYYNPDPSIYRFDGYIILTNTNNTDYTGDLRLEFDGDYTSPFDYDYFPSSELDDEVIWNNVSVTANSYRAIWLRVGYNSPTDPNFPLLPGDQLYYDLFLSNNAGREVNGAPDFTLIQTIDASEQTLSDNDIENTIQSSALKIFPNPTKDIINIENKAIEDISIYSINGQLIKSIDYKQDESEWIQMNVSHLDKGIYFISIQTETSTFTEKIIKN